MSSTETQPRQYFVSESDRREAYQFIRETLDSIVAGNLATDYLKLQLAYEKIGRPWCNITHDLVVLKKTRRYEAELAGLPEGEAANALADLQEIDKQIEELRETIRDLQHKRIASLRVHENWNRIEYAIRDAQAMKPHLFGDIDELAKGGGIVSETVALPQIAKEIRDALG